MALAIHIVKNKTLTLKKRKSKMTKTELKRRFENLLKKVEVLENNENWEDITCDEMEAWDELLMSATIEEIDAKHLNELALDIIEDEIEKDETLYLLHDGDGGYFLKR